MYPVKFSKIVVVYESTTPSFGNSVYIPINIVYTAAAAKYIIPIYTIYIYIYIAAPLYIERPPKRKVEGGGYLVICHIN